MALPDAVVGGRDVDDRDGAVQVRIQVARSLHLRHLKDGLLLVLVGAVLQLLNGWSLFAPDALRASPV